MTQANDVEQLLQVKREIYRWLEPYMGKDAMHAAILKYSQMTDDEMSEETFREFDLLCEKERTFAQSWKADKRCECVRTLPESNLPACKHIRKAMEKENQDLKDRALARTIYDMNKVFLRYRMNQVCRWKCKRCGGETVPMTYYNTALTLEKPLVQCVKCKGSQSE